MLYNVVDSLERIPTDGCSEDWHYCDLWVFRNAYPQMNEDYIRSELKKAGLAPFYRVRRWFEIIFLQKQLNRAVDVLVKGNVLQDYADHLNKVGLRKTPQE